jgi:protein phosphatase 1 regulatory subunit 7
LENLETLDLSCNFISKIENVGHLKELFEIYLQQNIIEKIENLETLDSLTSLDLAYNKIQKVENLTGLKQLEDIWINMNPLILDEDQIFGQIAHFKDTLICLFFGDSHSEVKIPDYVKKVKKMFPNMNQMDGEFNSSIDVSKLMEHLSKVQGVDKDGNQVKGIIKTEINPKAKQIL